MNFSEWTFWDWIGNSIYFLLAIDALWGAYSAAMVWLRVGQLQFKNEAQQDLFMEELKTNMENRDMPAAVELCSGDRRALPQLILLGLNNVKLGMEKLGELIAERFQRDVMADLEGHVSWINNVIKTAPMLGLLGTVMGMMGAFAKLNSGGDVKPEQLAGDISVALITTAIGLSIAIPATIFVNSINLKVRRVEDLVGSGLSRFFDFLAVAIGQKQP